ncbi:hypothetical protein CLV35_2229 [Motilibacter peucedani]|uniref:Uncharacterized protein n=1 Tax=Motilibacter peucedani TaxID=598650 RepID=A0A420XNH0_9ACTN|nr:hypothetical protein [Motilibacter peucedani]RKS73740.1 hypothetical protein CLV35_2229 [Motilibacter peucedani]
MSTTLEGSAVHSATRPDVVRRDSLGSRGRVIDLRRPASSVPAPGHHSVTVVREQESRTKRLRVALGRDAESPLMWQRVAEAVLAARPGDVVLVDVGELPELGADLVEFLRYADYVLARRGGTFVIEPATSGVFTHLRFGA